jgi:predicted nucleic acid-binding protein
MAAMTVYLDTSVVLRHLLRQPQSLSNWGRWERVYSSVLLRVESLRVLDRLRLERALNDEQIAELIQQLTRLFQSIDLVPLSEPVVERAAEPFPTAIETLDALHLATAIAVQKQERVELTFLTHDAQLGLAARSLSFPVVGI